MSTLAGGSLQPPASPSPTIPPMPTSSVESLPSDVSSTTSSTTSSSIISSTTSDSSTSISSTSSSVSSTTIDSSTTSQSSSTSSSTSSSSSATSVVTTLSETSTSVFASTSLTTSGGQVITAVVTVTTKIEPGTVITNTPINSHNRTSEGGTNVGAIVGGVVGGIAGLSVILALIFFLLRRRRTKNEFDGNFDPDYVSSGARLGNVGGGGTLPRMNIDEDDGMGGRLESGVVGGGIISPYSYTPSGHTNMSQVQPSNYSAASSAAPLIGGVAAGVGAAALRNRHSQSQQSHYGSGSGSYYPGSVSHEGSTATATSPSAWSASSAPYPASANPYAPSLPVPAELNSASSEHSSSGAGPYGGMASVSGGAYRPRSAKEIEAMGGQVGQPHVMNPDEAGAGPSSAYPPGAAPPVPHSVYNEQSRLAYLQNGPGHVPMPLPMQSTDSGVPDALRPGVGSGVIVHQDAGRVPIRKGERTQDEDEQQPREIPPTYDSLVNSRDREQQREE